MVGRERRFRGWASAVPAVGLAIGAVAAENPFGVMLPSRLVRSQQGIQVARELGAAYFRPDAVFVEGGPAVCAVCEAARRAGLKLVLTVRNNGPRATTPPADLGRYQRAVAGVVEQYRPEILVVENEENSALFYDGTPEAYASQLKAACEAAHRQGIRCTNGGLVSALVALLVYDDYLSRGERQRAEAFASRVFPPRQRQLLGAARAREQIRKGKALLASYRAAGADYVNFHWYITDPRALEEAVAYLKARSGLPAITNEVGQFTDDPEQTRAVMGKIVELGLPVAVWFGLDGPRARGLVDPDGRLRSTGQAFQEFIRRRFPRP
ncbi:MAG: hypothetical protein K6T59_02295 [Bryobacteraceae bacterium]|nr:hypothetical protein [Bryobacteraceae bacterium]